MSNYVYENPLDQGYKQFKLTKKQHNQLFKYCQIKWYDKYEYYYNKHEIIMHEFLNQKAVIITTILFPISLLFAGLSNTKRCLKELKECYNQKKCGSFSGDSIYSGTETYNKIMEIIGK